MEAVELTVEDCRTWWEKQVAKGYFTKYSFGFSRQDLIDKIGLGPESMVLEIGCGYGREASQFCKITDELYVSDISPSALELTKKHAAVKEAKVYDGEKLPWKDSFFDFVYSCFVIQHMSKASAGRLIADTLRVLKPGGSALHEFFANDSYCPEGGGDFLSGGDDGSMFNNSWSLDDIKAIVEVAGGTMAWIDTVDHGLLANEKNATYNHWVCIGK